MIKNLKVIAFDADDTLWDNEPFFQQVERDMCAILSPYADAETVSKSLFETEMGNMADYGYGAVAFTLSLVENACKVSQGKVRPDEILQIINLGKTLMHLKATPLAGVVETMQALKDSGKYQLVLFTKGELMTQEHKLQRSGLEPFFDKVVIVSNKKQPQYQQLCKEMGIEPSELLMVGNSLKSDIQPALEIGAWGVFIPYEVMWQHEVIEHFEHERMMKINRFEELKRILL